MNQLWHAYVVQNSEDGVVREVGEHFVATMQHFDQRLLGNQLETQHFEIVAEVLSEHLNSLAGRLGGHRAQILNLNERRKNCHV